MVTFPGGERQPTFGIGTWRMGEVQKSRAAEVASVRAAIDLGFRVIDTAECTARERPRKWSGLLLPKACAPAT